MPRLRIGDVFEVIIDFLREFCAPLFMLIKDAIDAIIDAFVFILELSPFWVVALVIGVIAYKRAGKGIAIFSVLGILLIDSLNMWPETVSTLALIFTATIIALAIGIPLGILSAKFKFLNKILRPVLDFMQTMPAFVYLIPAVLFFRIGAVPAVISTIIFAMPPAIRLTDLGIRQVPAELVEAGTSFGSVWYQMLFKIQLPLAMPTIMAGVNQCIMLSLSMVVIASMIGAGGLGSIVLTCVQTLKVGMGFGGGLAVVIIAIILDRVELKT
ncbi:MAG: ABC transporter permease subunit [Lentisphaerae bacterium]|nr:ABC transporter permease subunit [Lentisphaerota bacterium]